MAVPLRAVVDAGVSEHRRRPKIVVAPDKFKGSLTAVQAAQAIADGLRRSRADIDVVQLPVADGGDGTVAAALAAGYERRTATVQGPTGEPVEATFAVRGEQAVLELAEASGLSRLPHGTLAPLTASTYGTGQLLLAALDAGCRSLILGVGGSASTDGGAGMVQALGARFLSAAGEEVGRGGAALLDLDRVDPTLLDPRLASTTVILACDVDNPLVGAKGAATVYGPQKGATSDDVELLDKALSHYAQVVHRDMGLHLSHRAGAGAAGGTGAGAIAFLGAISSSGIELMLEVVGFARAVEGADLVITGEGSLDAQSLSGKTPVGVARAAASAGVPVIALVGRLEVGPDELRAVGITSARALLELEPDDILAQRDAAVLLARLAEEVGASW